VTTEKQFFISSDSEESSILHMTWTLGTAWLSLCS